MMRTLLLVSLIAATFLPETAIAAEPQKPENRWSFNARYRHEFADDAGFSKNANADTLRLRAGFAPQLRDNWGALAEVEGVAELNDRFNSGANREAGYPFVADARALELNQAWLAWKNEKGAIKLGRQRITLDNQRFIGNVGWRQNEQTFDAVNGQLLIGKHTQAQLIWLNRVHRVFGDEAIDPLARERQLDGRLLRIEQSFTNGSLVGYGYWIEDKDSASASSRTLGVRWVETWPMAKAKFGVALEAARQSGYADATAGKASYVFIEPKLEYAGTTYRLGYEKLGSGKPRSFQTPLATLHAFNGWADKFLVTPANGLVDSYASAQRGFEVLGRKARWELAWHEFRADGGVRYGTEWDASAGITLRPGLQALVKVADYQSEGFAKDTRKVWLQMEWSR
jgi:hypothetical protein